MLTENILGSPGSLSCKHGITSPVVIGSSFVSWSVLHSYRRDYRSLTNALVVAQAWLMM